MEKNIKIITLSNQKIEEYKENVNLIGENFIKYGESNGFDKFLHELLHKSPLHSGIIEKKIRMDVGEGLVLPRHKTIFDELDKNFLNKIFFDLELYGGCYIGVKWRKKTIIGIEHVPFNYIRLSEPNENDEIEYCYLSKNWEKYKKKEYKPVVIPTFTGNYNGNDYEIAILGSYRSCQLYPMPSYTSAINYITADWLISKFHLSNIQNGFNPGAMVVFTSGEPTPEEEEYIIKTIQTNTGPDGAGKYIVYFAESADKAPIITQLPVNELDKQFKILEETITEKIITAHQIPRILAGLQTPGSLGDSKQLLQADETFHANYITYSRQIILDFLNKIAEKIGINEEIYIKNNTRKNNGLIIDNIQYIRDIFTINELRYIFGFQPIENQPIENQPNNLN